MGTLVAYYRALPWKWAQMPELIGLLQIQFNTSHMRGGRSHWRFFRHETCVFALPNTIPNSIKLSRYIGNKHWLLWQKILILDLCFLKIGKCQREPICTQYVGFVAQAWIFAPHVCHTCYLSQAPQAQDGVCGENYVTWENSDAKLFSSVKNLSILWAKIHFWQKYHTFCVQKNSANLREPFKYYFADFVCKGGGGVPPKSVTPFSLNKQDHLWMDNSTVN